MLNIHLRSLRALALLVLTLALASCGGAGPTPLNGTSAMPTISVTLSPQTVTLTPGGSVTFNATVNNATNPAVGWTVNGITGGNSTIGTIDQLGHYSAPISVPAPPTVTVSAVSQADNSQAANASVTIKGTAAPVTVTISPASSTVYVGQSIMFTATVAGAADTSVSWQLDGLSQSTTDASLGAIAVAPGSPDHASYTAPATVPKPSQVTITAVSNAYPSQTASATVTISKLPTQPGVSITGPSSTVFVGQPCSFTAVAVGLANPAVSWQVDGITGGNSSVGTITGGQLSGDISTATYTEPTVSGPTQFTITAVSVSNPSVSASAVVTVTALPPNAQVTISPTSATVYLGRPQVFTASVTGATDTSVSWLLNGQPPNSQDQNLGTLTTLSPNQASYTAPLQLPGTPTVTITAVSNANPAKAANATVTLAVSASVTVSPTTATVYVGLTQVFVATVSGVGVTDTSVSWQVNGISNGNSSVGTIQAGANNSATYTAPTTVPQPAQVTITAVSNAVPSQTASATVTVSKLPTQPGLSIAGPSSTILVGEPCSFTAVAVGLSNPAVSWQVNGITGGNSSVGTIAGGQPAGDVSTATYTEPSVSSPTKFTITAVSVSNPSVSASAVVTVAPPPPPPGVTISPKGATLYPGVTQVFTATVTGETDTSVSWQVDGITDGNSALGTIQPGANNSATYTPPAQVTTASQVTVTAVSNAQPSVFGSATVSLVPPPPPITVSVLPSSADVVVNTTQQYTATVANAENPTVTWQVNNIPAGNIGTVGSIDNTGLYTAPAAIPSGMVTIQAVSNQNSQIIGTATAVIEPAPVTQVALAPPSVSVQAGLSQEFTATVTGTTDPAVNFAVNGEVGGDSTIGTISAVGPPVGNVTTALYLAPTTVPTPPTVQVTAISAYDGTTSAPATVTIQPAPQIQVTVAPSSQTLMTGQTQTFTATVTNTTDQLVSWGISGPSCTGLACGTIASTGPLTANYIAPQNVPSPNPTVTVTATADASSSAQGTASVTVEPGTPTISIQPGSWTIQAGLDNTVNFSAIIDNAPADTPVVWGIGCISLYDGTPGEACRDLDFSGGGPGCISLPGLFKVCSNQPLPATAGNEPLMYYAPHALSTASFQENACQPTNQGIAQVPLTASMSVGGTQFIAPTVCITITQ